MQESKCKIGILVCNKPSYKYKKNHGFTIIEALVFLFIFAVITLSFYETFNLGMTYILNAKNRLGAVSLAREKMEIIRSLPYNSIGTINGAVSGNLADEEDIWENARLYKVRTIVEYVQDSFDGVYPSDPVWQDYKKVTVAVTWTEKQPGSEEVRISSRFVPPGLEVTNEGDGILVINVFSDQPGGSGIANSWVHVINNETGLNANVETDSTGSVSLMGDKIKEAIQKYEITVSKTGYETVSTMPPYPDTTYNPVNVHGSVIAGSVNVVNIVQNLLTNLKIKTVDYLSETGIPNIAFHLEGGKKLGNEVESPYAPVYNMNVDAQTNSNGEKDFNNISPGQYTLTLSSSVVNYALVEMTPNSPFSLYSNNNLTVEIKLADVNVESLLLRVMKNDSEGNKLPVEGAQVRLYNNSGYEAVQHSSPTGTVFFPVANNPLLAGDYNLEITADDFNDYNSQVTIEENKLKTETITLTPL